MSAPTAIAPVASETIIALILGMLVINFALRFVPLAALSRVHLPREIMRWLSYIPIAVMGALLATETMIPALDAAQGISEGSTVPLVPLYLSPGIYGALVAMLTYRFSKSFIGSTLAGVAVFALIQWLVGM